MARVQRNEQIPLGERNNNGVYTYYYLEGDINNNNERAMVIFIRRLLIAILCVGMLGMLLFSTLGPIFLKQRKVLSNSTYHDTMDHICVISSLNGTCTKTETPPSTLNIKVELLGEMKYVNSTEYKTYVEEISFEDINDQAVPVRFQFIMQLVGVSPKVSFLGGSYLQCEDTTLNVIFELDAESSFSFRFFRKKARKGILRLTRGCFHLKKGIKLSINLHSLRLVPILMAYE